MSVSRQIKYGKGLARIALLDNTNTISVNLINKKPSIVGIANNTHMERNMNYLIDMMTKDSSNTPSFEKVLSIREISQQNATLAHLRCLVRSLEPDIMLDYINWKEL